MGDQHDGLPPPSSCSSVPLVRRVVGRGWWMVWMDRGLMVGVTWRFGLGFQVQYVTCSLNLKLTSPKRHVTPNHNIRLCLSSLTQRRAWITRALTRVGAGSSCPAPKIVSFFKFLGFQIDTNYLCNNRNPYAMNRDPPSGGFFCSSLLCTCHPWQPTHVGWVFSSVPLPAHAEHAITSILGAFRLPRRNCKFL